MLFPVQIRWKQETKLCSHQFLSLHILTTNSVQVRALQNQETECTLSAVARMFSSPVISYAGRWRPINRHVNQLWSKPQRHNTGDWRHFNLHPHLSNESTKLSLVKPVLHHSVCECLRLCACGCICVRKPKVTLSQPDSRRCRSAAELEMAATWTLMMHWHQRSSVSDRLTYWHRGSFCASVWHFVTLHVSSFSLDMNNKYLDW